MINVPPNFNAFLNFQQVTKSVEQVVLAHILPDAMRRAFTQVRNGRPRPVMVEIPLDLFAEDIAEPLVYQPVPRLRSAPDPLAIDEVARVLVDAKRPVIYAGEAGAVCACLATITGTGRAAGGSCHHELTRQERLSRNPPACTRLRRTCSPQARAAVSDSCRCVLWRWL